MKQDRTDVVPIIGGIFVLLRDDRGGISSTRKLLYHLCIPMSTLSIFCRRFYEENTSAISLPCRLFDFHFNENDFGFGEVLDIVFYAGGAVVGGAGG